MKIKYVLGLNLFHSDTSACLFKNGELVSAAEEERFTRVKHTSLFPNNAIKFCLEQANIKLSEIDIVTINSNPFSSNFRKFLFTLKDPRRLKMAFSTLLNIKKKMSLKDYLDKIDPKNNFTGKIKFIDHHYSHIASSLFFSNFDECANISIDGFGDFVSTSWGPYKNGNFNFDDKIFFPHSLGIFYQAMTQYLGFKNYGDEYKVMGLSSYGSPKYKKEILSLFTKISDGFELNLKYFTHHNNKIFDVNNQGQIIYKNLYTKKLIDLLGPERKKTDQITQYHKDLAKSVQSIYEDIFFDLLNSIYKKYNTKNLTISGGCAMNSVANGKIIQRTPFERIYVSPNPGDAGGSIGSAVSFIQKEYKISKFDNKHYAYLGSFYTNQEIEKIIKENNLINQFRVEKLEDDKLFESISQSLIDSKIIGWFQHKMEWGARALGNRSILADARNPKIKDIINLKIKRRESFRPFAPSILLEQTSDWFEVKNPVPYMSEVYQIKKEKRKILPAITHVDGSGRLQTVSEENNQKYYNLIKRFYEKTQVPILLNTSFNENEPIVESPQNAIDCYLRTEMDILVLGNWVISR